MDPDNAPVTAIPVSLSEEVFTLSDSAGVERWLVEVSRAVGGVSWPALGGIPNNVHTVEVASDPALALVERPINGFDALLDLAARERGETAATPHEAARRWFGIPSEGLRAMPGARRRELAAQLQLSIVESDVTLRPTIVVQDGGTGQHPDDFPSTLLSLLASNKKDKLHQMGVYNAGGAASCRFSAYTIVVSRLAPSLLEGREDSIGTAVIRYNPLDPDRYKSGTYEYLAAKDGSILRLDLDELPTLSHGTYVKLVEYDLAKYARAAQEPKQSLWHLLHAALPDPPLPLRIVETRTERFPGVREGGERRTVSGLLHLLSRPEVAKYSDVREVHLGIDIGTIVLRYFVLNEDRDPDAYTKSDQGLTITLNGQRQITRDRYWVKRHVDVPFIFKRLVIVVDATGLTNAAKRNVFSSTREQGVDSPEARTVIDRVLSELLDDETLSELDELAKQRALEAATKSTTDKVKRQLANQIHAYIKGEIGGAQGGKKKPRARRRGGGGGMPDVDDSLMLDVPDTLRIASDPIRIRPGGTAALRLEINAKNDFLPRYAEALSVVFDEALREHVFVRAQGRLLGGKVRVTLEAGPDAPIGKAGMRVALVVPEKGVLLTADGGVAVVARTEDKKEDSRTGGEPDIDVQWVRREGWTGFTPAWDSETVGLCHIHRGDPANPAAITRVEWFMNENFGPYEQVVQEKRMTEDQVTSFQEAYEYPVLFGLFRQTLAEEAKEQEADERGERIEVPDDYVRGERARMARAVLMAMEPEMKLMEAMDGHGSERAPALT
jgi:hypothetical protein